MRLTAALFMLTVFACAQERPNRPRQGPPDGGAERQSLTLPFNNAQAIVRSQDGLRHAVAKTQGKLEVIRFDASGEKGRQTIADKLNGCEAIACDGENSIMVLYSQGKIGAYWALSEDGGQEYSTPAQIPGSQGASGLALRLWRKGKDVLGAAIWHVSADKEQRTGDVYAAFFRQGAWEAPTKLGSGLWATISGFGDECYAAWKMAEGAGKMVLQFADCPAPGKTWSEPRRLWEGADPCLAVASDGTIYLGYQLRMQVFLTSAKECFLFSKPVLVGDGLFAHVSVNAEGHVAMSWERFTRKGSSFDDSIKAVGLALSRDLGKSFEMLDIYEKESGQQRAACDLGDDGELDCIWVDADTEPRQLLIKTLKKADYEN